MIKARLAAHASLVSLAVLLAGCGGGGGDNSTPTPTPAPTPAPPPSYLTLTELVAQGGDRSFETAGVEYHGAPDFTGGATTQKFGSGVKVDYQASSGNYTLTAPNSDTGVFNDPADVTMNDAAHGVVNFANASGNLSLIVPQVDGVPLSYTLIGIWGGPQWIRIAAGGIPTIKSDVPISGTAIYKMSVGGSATAAGGNTFILAGSGATGTFTANFTAGTIATTIDLSGTDVVLHNGAFDFGILTGSGLIDSGGPGFSGTLTQTGGSGLFAGAFFGPQAAEFGYGWVFKGTSFAAAGANAGKKN
jgi:hypothetical protein